MSKYEYKTWISLRLKMFLLSSEFRQRTTAKSAIFIKFYRPRWRLISKQNTTSVMIFQETADFLCLYSRSLKTKYFYFPKTPNKMTVNTEFYIISSMKLNIISWEIVHFCPVFVCVCNSLTLYYIYCLLGKVKHWYDVYVLRPFYFTLQNTSSNTVVIKTIFIFYNQYSSSE